MKSDSYWTQRMETLNESLLNRGEKFTQTMNREYAKATASIQKDIDVFYQRFAKNNGMSLSEARRIYNKGELKEFKWTVDDYIKAGRENAVDQRWMKELENASLKVRITRLEALQTQMRQHIEVLSAKRQSGTQGLLSGIYKDGYHQSIFELQKGIGLGASFAKLDQRQLESLLSNPWAPDARSFSQRIWGDRNKMINELQTTLVQGLIKGVPSDTMINQIKERFDVSRSNAERLVLTESAFFSGHARRAAYAELNVEEFENVATLDKRTSKICRTMDGTVFKLSEAQPGVNCAPFHARCRTVDIPHFEDNIVERAASTEDGKTYNVPGDMTYPEWEKQHVKGEVGEPDSEGANRKYNPKASYHVDLPNVSSEVLDRVADVNRNLARQGYKDGKETAVVMDSAAGNEIARISGTINKVKFSKEMDSALRTANNNSLILTHNHPRGTRVNLHDLQNLGNYPSIASLLAVGHDGGVSFVSTLGKSVDLVILNETMARVARKVDKELKHSSKYATMSVSEQLAYMNHLVLLGVVGELGWKYGEEFSQARGSGWGI